MQLFHMVFNNLLSLFITCINNFPNFLVNN